ncbi:MAG: pantoate--beta-alanine ligase [Gammaproteobacteria bacterium]
MLIVSDVDVLRQKISEWRLNKERIAFVPTMGNLHAGHLQLVKEAKTIGDRVVCSIFVNPAQFGPNEDFERYPRTLEKDRDLLATEGIDLIFTPSVDTIYPAGIGETTTVTVPGVSEGLCNNFRPGHFTGVATVVARLFLLAQPDCVLLGKKDFQQLMVIEKMVSDLCFPIEVMGVDTVREADGLAMSSRNQYLSVEERKAAPALFQVLQELADTIRDGDHDFRKLEREAEEKLHLAGFSVDYVAVCQRNNLRAAVSEIESLVILIAASLGKSRLIDNVTI